MKINDSFTLFQETYIYLITFFVIFIIKNSNSNLSKYNKKFSSVKKNFFTVNKINFKNILIMRKI